MGGVATLLQVVRCNCILCFQLPHNTLCLPPPPNPPQILHKPLFSNASESTAFSQEHLKTITYAKFKGGEQRQTECIIGRSKIEYSVNARWGRISKEWHDCLPQRWGNVTRNGRLPNSKLGAVKQEEIWWRSDMTDYL